MDTVKKARQYIKNMKETDSTSEHYKLIEDLLLEVTCLKMQVNDRGQSYKRKVKENERLRATLVEVSGCLTEHNTPKLCDGCLISIADALH